MCKVHSDMHDIWHRCVHVHELLDKLNTFQEYYQRNRQLQLQSDLQVPADFAGKPQIWLGRIVGFFLVEDRVQRTATTLPVSTQVICPEAQATQTALHVHNRQQHWHIAYM